jgi:hypothetical protein
MEGVEFDALPGVVTKSFIFLIENLTSLLQLHSVITVRTLSSFWIPSPSLLSSGKQAHSQPSHFSVVFRDLSYSGLLSVKVEVTLRLTVSQSVSKLHLGLMTRYLLVFGIYGLVFVWRPL